MLNFDVLVFFLVMAVATFLTRVIPFVAMHRFAEHALVKRLGAQLPPMLMVILVIYGVLTLRYESPSAYGLTAVSMVVTASLQWLWRQPLLSIVSGTGLYVCGVQWFGV